ncbi:hypothetical protein [Desulfatiferula olefinivorans]
MAQADFSAAQGQGHVVRRHAHQGLGPFGDFFDGQIPRKRLARHGEGDPRSVQSQIRPGRQRDRHRHAVYQNRVTDRHGPGVDPECQAAGKGDRGDVQGHLGRQGPGKTRIEDKEGA